MGKPRNTQKYPTYPEIPEIPGNTRKKKRYPEIPDRIFRHSYPTRTWPATRYFVQYPTRPDTEKPYPLGTAFQEFDGLLPVSSSVGDSSASKDFCWRTIFVIKMADLSKHVLKRKYYCKFSSRASRKVLLNFTSPFWRTKRVCDVVLPESFKCLTSRCWVGTFHWLIQLLRTILTLPH